MHTAPKYRRSGLYFCVLALVAMGLGIAGCATDEVAPDDTPGARLIPCEDYSGGRPPVIAYSSDAAMGFWGAAISEPQQRAYVSTRDGRLLALDISDLREPVLLGEAAPLPWSSGRLLIQGDLVFAGSGSVVLLDFSAVAEPVELARMSHRELLGVVGDHLYTWRAGDREPGFLDIHEIVDPTQPRFVRSLQVGTAYSALARFGDTVFTNVDSWIRWFDVSDPGQPVEVGSRNEELRASGNLVAVGDLLVWIHSRVLNVARVAPDGEPSVLSQLYLGGGHSRVQVRKDLVLAHDWLGDEVAAVDIADPTAPSLIGEIQLPGRLGMLTPADGGILFGQALEWEKGLTVLAPPCSP